MNNVWLQRTHVQVPIARRGPVQYVSTFSLLVRTARAAAMLALIFSLTACSDSPESSSVLDAPSTVADRTRESIDQTTPYFPTLTPSAKPPRSTAPPVTEAPAAPRTSVPDVLVGTWGGGSEGATAGRSYKFGRSGDVLFRRGNTEMQGTVVVDQDTLTLYFPGLAPQKYQWSTDSYSIEGYAFSNLYLDGYTYVRQD